MKQRVDHIKAEDKTAAARCGQRASVAGRKRPAGWKRDCGSARSRIAAGWTHHGRSGVTATTSVSTLLGQLGPATLGSPQELIPGSITVWGPPTPSNTFTMTNGIISDSIIPTITQAEFDAAQIGATLLQYTQELRIQVPVTGYANGGNSLSTTNLYYDIPSIDYSVVKTGPATWTLY